MSIDIKDLSPAYQAQALQKWADQEQRKSRRDIDPSVTNTAPCTRETQKGRMTNQQQARQQWQNRVNNAQGHFFEGAITAACRFYHDNERAEVEKTPEPFRVTQKSKDGIFTGRFTALAAPDFQGTLAGGRSIVFEAKYTTKDTIRRSVLTDAQMTALESHMQRGAVSAVCAGINDQFFFVPWPVWRDMKANFGKVSLRAVDLAAYRVCFSGAVLFLDYMHNDFETVFG